MNRIVQIDVFLKTNLIKIPVKIKHPITIPTIITPPKTSPEIFIPFDTSINLKIKPVKRAKDNTPNIIANLLSVIIVNNIYCLQ